MLLTDVTGELERGVKIRDKHGKPVTVHTQSEILTVLEEYRKWTDDQGVKWKMEEALKALSINPSHLVEPWILELIQQFLFYRNAPHAAYGVPYDQQPSTWVDASGILGGIFSVSL
jgi:hypothetical protein